MTRKICPNCDNYETERVNVEWMPDVVEETRICDCGAQYRVSFANPIKEIDEVIDLDP